VKQVARPEGLIATEGLRHERDAMPTALTIAGSDSGGGAGIQADLKTFTAFRVFGLSAITGLTAQNTRGVRGVELPTTDFIAAQLRAVLEDIRADAAPTSRPSASTAR
jgi:hydroxymethylpyrimidine/phosphomethylpyrimidine kinase